MGEQQEQRTSKEQPRQPTNNNMGGKGSGSMKKGMPVREGAGRPPKKKEEKAPSPAPSPPRTPPRERSKSPERSKTPPHERNKELEGLSPYERYWMMQNGQCR